MVDKFKVGKEYYKTGDRLPVKCIHIEDDTAILMCKEDRVQVYTSKNPILYDEYKKPLTGEYWVVIYRGISGEICQWTFSNPIRRDTYVKGVGKKLIAIKHIKYTEGDTE